MKIYDTRLRKKVDFEPICEGEVRMYVCGPTVYNRIHIGNARTFISFDIIRRYLEWRGFKVIFVQNVTDVDDKIIKRAAQEDKSAEDVASEYTKLFIEDMRSAGVSDPTYRPYATKEIDTMIELVELLIEKGNAYESNGDVYFAVRTFDDYGKLSGRNIDEAQAGHRELQGDFAHAQTANQDENALTDRKRDPLDFALWKAAKPGEPSWSSPWGAGRPGWHIECSAMSHKYLGTPFDIHGGGSDLIFPHHENECAQSQAAYGCTFANHWMHSGMLQIANEKTGEVEKMSKSLNNFLLLHEALDIVHPEALRMLILLTHYRSPLVFGDARLSEANTALTRIETAVRNVDWLLESNGWNKSENTDGARDENTGDVRDEKTSGARCEKTDDPRSENDAEADVEPDAGALMRATSDAHRLFCESMDDDFNAPEALGAIFGLVSEVNTALAKTTHTQDMLCAISQARDMVADLMGCFGIDVSSSKGSETNDSQSAGANYPDEILQLAKRLAGFEGNNKDEAAQALLGAREQARKEKNWSVADEVRDGLSSLGFTIEDTPLGARVSFKG